MLSMSRNRLKFLGHPKHFRSQKNFDLNFAISLLISERNKISPIGKVRWNYAHFARVKSKVNFSELLEHDFS